jgi:N6-adenosine-specific RNA methylase IME4
MTTTTTLFRCITIDPPWYEQGGGKVKRGADRHYRLLRTPEILDEVSKAEPWARRDLNGCHVWLWAPSWRVATGEAAEVLRALGVRPVRKLVWTKDRMGIGQYARGAHEDVVLGVIGKLRPLPTARGVSDVVAAPHPKEAGKRIHSAKPPEAYARIEAISPGPRLEMFARRHRPGWEGWGDEVDREIGAPSAGPLVDITAELADVDDAAFYDDVGGVRNVVVVETPFPECLDCGGSGAVGGLPCFSCDWSAEP